MNKQQLIILSDIFGCSNESWMDQYLVRLSPYFHVTLFDSRKLAGIEPDQLEAVHKAFATGGIDRAARELEKSKDEEIQIVIGFSVGGTVAWKYALNNPEVSLHLISATRLRYETNKPSSEITLYFGRNEENGPMAEWFETMNLNPIVVENESHECYKSERVIERVCRRVLADVRADKT